MWLVWCIEDDRYFDYAAVEEFEDLEQPSEFVEGKSLMHALFPIQLHFNYTIYFIACIKLMGPYD